MLGRAAGGAFTTRNVPPALHSAQRPPHQAATRSARIDFLRGAAILMVLPTTGAQLFTVVFLIF